MDMEKYVSDKNLSMLFVCFKKQCMVKSMRFVRNYKHTLPFYFNGTFFNVNDKI